MMEPPVYDDEPGHELDRHTGKCHICRIVKPISFCSMCEHWMCWTCRDRWFRRALAFLMEKIGENKGPGCCGPLEEIGA